MLDPCTFGNSKASKTLVKLLDKYPPSVTRKASRCYCHYNHGLNELDKIEDAHVRLILLKLWADFHIDVDRMRMIELPYEIRTYLFNVMIKGYRNFTKEARSLRAQQRANQSLRAQQGTK